MHFHLPKPLHGWRALAGEVGIIVIGVLIALAAEQAVEMWTWHEKVDAAKRSLDFEINVQLDSAEEAVALDRCAAPYLDALESAIAAHDRASIEKLYAAHAPFEPRQWRSTGWQSVLSTQVADHMDPVAMAQYGFIYSGTEKIRQLQDSIIADFGQATMGRIAGAEEAGSVPLELAAAERLRAELREVKGNSGGMLLVASGGVHAGWKPIHRVRAAHLDSGIKTELKSCEGAANAVHEKPS